MKTITVTYEVVVPEAPDMFQLAGAGSMGVHVGNISEDVLMMIGAEWTQELLRKARGEDEPKQGCSPLKIRHAKEPAVKTKGPEPQEPPREQIYPRKNARKKSQYKGVAVLKNGKFGATWWDGKNMKCVRLGTFDSELLAAACYQEHVGNKDEAKRLRNEYQEGDGLPEPEGSIPQKKYTGVYPAVNAAGVTRYHAQIGVNKKNVHLGTHDTPEHAAEAIARYKKKNNVPEIRRRQRQKARPPEKNERPDLSASKAVGDKDRPVVQTGMTAGDFPGA